MTAPSWTVTDDGDPCAEGCNLADSQAVSVTEDQCRRCGRTAPVLDEDPAS